MELDQVDLHLMFKYRPLLLFAALVALGLAYIGLFVFFTTRSVDFVSAGKIAQANASQYPADTAIEVGQDRPGSELLVAGWHQPEAWGAWSREGEVTLLVPRCVGEGTVVVAVRLTVGAVADALREAGLQSSWEGTGAGGAVSSGPILQAPRMVDVALPDPGCHAGEVDRLLLKIETATPRSPKELGTGEDGRALGFALNSVEFLTAETAKR